MATFQNEGPWWEMRATCAETAPLTGAGNELRTGRGRFMVVECQHLGAVLVGHGIGRLRLWPGTTFNMDRASTARVAWDQSLLGDWRLVLVNLEQLEVVPSLVCAGWLPCGRTVLIGHESVGTMGSVWLPGLEHMYARWSASGALGGNATLRLNSYCSAGGGTTYTEQSSTITMTNQNGMDTWGAEPVGGGLISPSIRNMTGGALNFSLDIGGSWL